MNPLVFVVDDEPDVEVLFRQHFRRDLRTDRFTMEFAQSAHMALQCITDAGDRSLILVLSDINLGSSTSGWDVAECFRIERPAIPVLYMSGDRIEFERCVPGSMFVAKPLNHEDILSACRRLA